MGMWEMERKKATQVYAPRRVALVWSCWELCTHCGLHVRVVLVRDKGACEFTHTPVS